MYYNIIMVWKIVDLEFSRYMTILIIHYFSKIRFEKWLYLIRYANVFFIILVLKNKRQELLISILIVINI